MLKKNYYILKIREEFQEIYGYDICNIDSIDDVTYQQRSNQRADNEGAYITDVIVHFINDNDAVDGREIQKYAFIVIGKISRRKHQTSFPSGKKYIFCVKSDVSAV